MNWNEKNAAERMLRIEKQSLFWFLKKLPFCAQAKMKIRTKYYLD